MFDGIFGIHQTGGATRFREAVDLLNTHPHRSECLHQCGGTGAAPVIIHFNVE